MSGSRGAQVASGGVVSRRKWARTASVSHAKTLRPARRQVSITVSVRSTNRLPDADCVPKESFRQMTACRNPAARQTLRKSRHFTKR